MVFLGPDRLLKSISEMGDLLGFLCTAVSRVYRDWSEKWISVKWAAGVWMKMSCWCLRRMSQQVEDDEKATVAQVTTYKYAENQHWNHNASNLEAGNPFRSWIPNGGFAWFWFQFPGRQWPPQSPDLKRFASFDKSATAWCHHINMNQNLRNVSNTLLNWATKNENGSEGKKRSNLISLVVPNKIASECVILP